MIPATALAYLKALEDKTPDRWCLVSKRQCACKEGCKIMALKPRVRVKAQGIPMAGVIVKTTDKGKTVVVKKDSAPPHVRAGRRRKAGKVTGARAAK